MLFKKIIKNFSVLAIALFFYKVLNLFTFILIARSLGVDGFGRLSFALSFVWLFNAFVDFGLRETLVKETASDDVEIKKKHIASVMTLRMLISLIVYCIILIASYLSPALNRTFSLNLIIALALVFNSFTIFFKSIFQAFEKMVSSVLYHILVDYYIFF